MSPECFGEDMIERKVLTIERRGGLIDILKRPEKIFRIPKEELTLAEKVCVTLSVTSGIYVSL